MSPLLSKILNQVIVVVAEFKSADECILRYYKCSGRKDCVVSLLDEEFLSKEVSKCPVVLLVGGYGVISKEVGNSEDLIEKIKIDPDNFLWNNSLDGRSFNFFRKSQFQSVADLDRVKCMAVSVFCIENISSEIEESILGYVNLARSEDVVLKNIVKPSKKGSLLALAVFNKLKMPVLCVLLLLLIANFFVSSSVEVKYSRVHADLMMLKKTQGTIESTSRKKQGFIEKFYNAFPYRCALICDRVGAVLPKGIVLNNIAFQPLHKGLEKDKQPIVGLGEIIISGEAKSHEDISFFVSRLNDETFVREVMLVSVDKNRDTQYSFFQIKVLL